MIQRRSQPARCIRDKRNAGSIGFVQLATGGPVVSRKEQLAIEWRETIGVRRTAGIQIGHHHRARLGAVALKQLHAIGEVFSGEIEHTV